MANLGSAAPRLVRQMMGRSPVFFLDQPSNGKLQVSTTGWNSAFAPM
jgi:hypothetical protein